MIQIRLPEWQIVCGRGQKRERGNDHAAPDRLCRGVRSHNTGCDLVQLPSRSMTPVRDTTMWLHHVYAAKLGTTGYLRPQVQMRFLVS